MKMCNNCKRVVDDNQSFCQYCGKNSFENITLHSEDEIKLELQQKKAEKEAKKEKRLKSLKRAVIIFVAINVIVYLITLIVFLVFDNDKNETEGATTVSWSAANIESAAFSKEFEFLMIQ